MDGEIKLRAVVRLQQQVAHLGACVSHVKKIAQGVKIAQTLGHFFMIDEKMLGVEPMADKLAARVAFGLSDFVFMVWEHVVDAAAVDIDART